jgi:outer membrane lipoprotein-sorting protein
MKIFRVFLVIALTLVFSASAFAKADSETQQMLNEIESKAGDIKSYRVDMKMKTNMMGQSMNTKGEMAFKKPNKMHMKTTTDMMGGMTQEIFSSGNTVWTYMPMMKMATKMDLSKIKAAGKNRAGTMDNADITKPFAQFPEGSVKYIEKKKTDNGPVYVFEAKPDLGNLGSSNASAPQMFPDKMTFWIGADTGLPEKIIMLGKDGSVMMEQTYSNFRINVDIDDSEFEFKPPQGVQVMDMTEGAVNMMQQMHGSETK